MNNENNGEFIIAKNELLSLSIIYFKLESNYAYFEW